MSKIKKDSSSVSKVFSAEAIQAKLESAMPEVHRQVKVYEEKLRTGKLSASPKSYPLFSE